MHNARYVRLYADERGETHFEDIEISLMQQDFAPPSAPLNIAKFFPVTGSFWLGAPGDWSGEIPHPTPQRQLLCTVEGEYEITVSDGEVRCFPAGSILLIEDTSGKGHQTGITYNRGVLVLGIALADEKKNHRNG